MSQPISRRTVLKGSGPPSRCPGSKPWRLSPPRLRPQSCQSGRHSSMCPTASTCRTGRQKRRDARRIAGDSRAAKGLQERHQRPQRPDARQGPGQRRRPRRPCSRPWPRSSPAASHARPTGPIFASAMSADQAIAHEHRRQHRFPSLELGIEGGRQGRQLRLRLQLCLLVEHLLARRSDAERQGDRPQAGLRAALRRRRSPSDAPRPRQARLVQARASSTSSSEDAKPLNEHARQRPTDASWTST